jgi:hypothetical protein
MPHSGWGVTRFKQIAACHPSEPHYANGLCRKCYRNTPTFKRARQEYYRNNKAQFQADSLRARQERRRQAKIHGVTPARLKMLLDMQGGVCAICSLPPRRRALSVDHDHRTGEVRGFLCGPCNGALGLFRDSPELLNHAIDYLTGKGDHAAIRAAFAASRAT